MTEKIENNATERKHLIENPFVYVTEAGEVNLKATSLFDERTLAVVDPEAAEEQIRKFQDAFENIEKKFDAFFDELASKRDYEADTIQQKFDALVDEALETDAIGDFETLISKAREKIAALTATDTAAADKKDSRDNAGEEEKSGSSPAETDTRGDAGEQTQPDSENTGNDRSRENPEGAGSETEKSTGEKQKEETDPAEAGRESEQPTGEGEETPVENYYRELAEKAETLSELSDWSYATMEFDNINNLWEEGPDPEGVDIKPYREKIDRLREELEEKKRAHYEEQKRIKAENLEKKQDLLKELQSIVDEKKWTHTREVSRIKGKWEQIKPVPASEQEKLESAFKKLLHTFDEHKVDRLVKKKQQEEDNLTGKLVILEKMETFLETVGESSDWKEIDKKLSDFARQFRKIGRVPAEKNQEVWDRFHAAQDKFHSLRFKHDKKYRKNIEKFLAKKKKLIDEAEALIDADNLAKAARKVNKLHRKWKKAGNLPQKDENELWDRFKAATDAFNEKKSENIELLRKQEDENYRKKLDIIDKANELKESEEWEKTHNEFQRLMEKWKEIGPVPRRKSGKIWKKFKGAMDYFYDRRREFFKEVKEERKDNLKEKEEILARLKELQTHDNPIEAVDQAKPLQEEFKKAGYVPIKHKNRLWKEYRETCDVIYDRYRAAKSAARIVGKENVENYSTDDIAEIKKKQDQAAKLRKQIDKLSEDLLQMKESLSYFKPSGSGSSLLDDVKKRIDNAEAEIEEKEEKLQQLEIEIDKIKRSS